MEKLPLISVIVPVYKTEAYLDKCISSIIGQTYRNLEIILVDDGSPDNCGAMCDAWAEKDSRIKVIHKENGGLSDARNVGMAAAEGRYIAFVDSDDWIAPEMYRLLHERLVVDKSDISACGVEMVYENGASSRTLTHNGSSVLSRQQAMEAVICETWLKQPVWYKLYKAEHVKDLYFPNGKSHEDVFWTYQAVARANSVSVFDTPCYYYLQRSGSIMGTAFSEKRLDAIDAKLQRIEFLLHDFPTLVSTARIDLFYTRLYLGQIAIICHDKMLRRITFHKLRNVQKRYKLTLGDWTALPLTHKIWALLAHLSLSMTCRLRNSLKIGL